MLPQFDTSIRVNSNTAKHDKIDFSFPVGGIADNEMPPIHAAFANHVYELLGGPEHLNDLPTDSDSHYSRLFGRRRGASALTLATRQRSSSLLLIGQLRGRKSEIATGNQLSFTFYAKANLTRYVRHQDVNRARRGAPPITDDATLAETLFRLRPDAYHDGKGEFSFDNNDNWIPQSALHQSFCNPWRERQREYLRASLFTVRQELERVQRHSAMLGHPLTVTYSDSSLIFQRIETYWEFSDADPLTLINRLELSLKAYCAGEFERRSFHDQSQFSASCVLERQMNCKVLVAKVAPGIELVIYAKTNKRVRFEVRYDLPEVSRTRELAQTCANVQVAVDRLAAVSADAANVINRFMEYLHQQNSFIPSSPSAVSFLFLCGQNSESASAAETIIRMLIVNECVVALKALRPSIDSLRAAGILQRTVNEQRNQSQMFNVTPAYRNALNSLRQVDSPHSLTINQRLRAPVQSSSSP